MHGGSRREGQPANSHCSAEGVEQDASLRGVESDSFEGLGTIHDRNIAIMAISEQVKNCDSRNCDSRSVSHDALMETEQIRAAMKARKIRGVHLANELGLTPDQVSKSLHGLRRFTAAEMDKIRRLLSDTPPPSIEGALPTRRIPVIGSVSAGNWKEAIQQPMGTMPMPEEDLPDDSVALRVVGDSMDKLVPDGGIVIFTPSDRELFADNYYIVLNEEGETTFKQYKSDPARLVPCSSNPRHTDISIGDGKFQIVGRVEWYAARPPRRLPG
jgi:SOS-response transcriptional repressor LexA